MEKIKIMVADDHPIFQEGLRRLLEDEEDLKVIAQPVDGEETVRLGIQLVPDVALINVAMPKLNGIEAARQLKKACPNTAILMVGTFHSEAYLLASLQAGAAGYLLKNTTFRELVNAVRSVQSGQGVFDLKLASKVLQLPAENIGEKKSGLSGLHRREQEVLRLAAKGIGNREIAKELVISERTVQTHLVNIFRKLGVSSRIKAILYALKEGWLNLDEVG